MKLSEELRECAESWTEDRWLNAWADQAELLEDTIVELVTSEGLHTPKGCEHLFKEPASAVSTW